MAKIIEARVIQKIDTEANWMANTLILYKGEQAFVSDKNNFKIGDGTKTFAQLEYYYKGDILGSVNTTDDLNAKPDGVYRAQTSGTYNGIVVKEGYYTLLRKEGSVWKLESEVEMPIQDLTPISSELNFLTSLTGANNILKNSFFKDLSIWRKNEDIFTFDKQNGYAHINTGSSTNTAIVQDNIELEIGEYIAEFRVKKNNTSTTAIEVFDYPKTDNDIIDLIDDLNWHTYRLTLYLTEHETKSIIFKVWGVNSDISIDYITLYQADGSVISDVNEIKTKVGDIDKYIGIENYISNGRFQDGLKDWKANETNLVLIKDTEGLRVDSTGTSDPALYQDPILFKKGKHKFSITAKKVSTTDATFRLGALSEGQVFVSKLITNNDWFNITFDATFENDSTGLFIFAPTPNSIWVVEELRAEFINENSIVNDISTLKTEVSQNKYIPQKNAIKTPYYDYLKPFIQKYYSRTSDVTIVQIGDSISTDLNWTDKRPDANERPPFCTEYNVNSFLEEKLRWKEQKYRRFDYAGVFTETLGGGISSVKETDDKWGTVGASFYYPITKVIDGGTNAGISFGFPSNHKRLSLILHSDQLFATETKVTISSGNGKVEVWNGFSWVEANNYTTSFQETSDPIIGAIEPFYMDNAQKRLKFRSLSDLASKTITVQNIGAGRFGYWGIEYSPNDYLFTYICASKGSHSIARLQQYETWMVDSFNPDLVLWQMPILNEGLGVPGRGWDSSGFNVQFINKYNYLKNKGYLILPYILWAATYSEFVDTNGNFLSGLANGKIVSPFADVANIMSVFLSNDYPVIDLFNAITEVAINKGKEENGNLYSSALVGSGKNGNTFTIDGIHLNKLGEDVVWSLMEHYFNF